MKRTIAAALLLMGCTILLSVLLPEGSAAQTPPVQEAVPSAAQSAAPESARSTEAPETAPERGASFARDTAFTLTVWSEGEAVSTTAADYLPGVLAGEMPADFSEEALRAQAVAARTYLLSKQTHGCASHPEASVCDDPACCKAWLSDAAMQEKWGDAYAENLDRMRRAVLDTDGEYLSYAGEPIQAVFHSSSAGKTESSENVWQALPYLVSVDSPETPEDVPNFVTEVEVSPETLREKVSSVHPAAGFSGAPETWLGSLYFSESGRVTYVTVGGAVLSGTEMRKLFDLRSTCFTVEYTGERFLFRVTGYGHGVGMSQYGANVMAQQGASYAEILAHYYPGTELVSPEPEERIYL